MSKDFFRVKKGLNIKPTDPATVTDLEDGDIIVDSTDNQLKKYSEEDGEFSTIAGSGGTVANFFSDFDKLTPTVSNATVADDSVVFLPIDDNKKSKKATFSAAGSVLYEVAASADLEGNQGLMTVWIKTNLQGVTVSTTTDGVVQSTLSVIATGKWKQYEIPYVIGGTNQGLIVESANAGDINIDEPFVGLAPAGYIQQVGQAHFVGDINFNSTNCQWTINTGTTFQSFPVDADCSYQTRGNVLQPDTNIPAIKIPNARTDGYYQVVFNGTFGVLGTASDDICIFNLSDSTSEKPNGGFAYTQNSAGLNGADAYIANEITGQFKFTTGGDKTIQVLVKPEVSGDACGVYATETRYGGTIAVHFYPDASSTIVSQQTELTAQTANEFSGFVNGTTAVVSDENYDWLDGNCTHTVGTGIYDCSIKSNIFTENPNLTCTAFSSNRTCMIAARSSTSFTVYTRVTSGGSIGDLLDSSFFIKASKSGSDVNKSATIIGKFNAVNMADDMQTKCQKKYLSGNKTSDVTDEPSLRFTNLTIGKRYKITQNFRTDSTMTNTDNVSLESIHNDNTVLIGTHTHTTNGGTGVFVTSHSNKFIASATILKHDLSSITSATTTVSGLETETSTWVELCQLPDTYVDTDEW